MLYALLRTVINFKVFANYFRNINIYGENVVISSKNVMMIIEQPIDNCKVTKQRFLSEAQVHDHVLL